MISIVGQPMIPPDEDPQSLWKAFWETGTDGAERDRTREALFRHYQPLVKMVRGRAFSGADASYSITPEDLEQYGALGLLEAIARYQPEKGSFESYANRYVWGRMMHGLKDSDLTPKGLAAKGTRWHTEPLIGEDEDGDDGPVPEALIGPGEEEFVEHVAASLQAELLAACIARLPARRRRTAREHLLGGQDLKRLAAAFHLPPRRVKREILPATRRQLKGLLATAGATARGETFRIFEPFSGGNLFFFSGGEGNPAGERRRGRGRPRSDLARQRTAKLGHRVTTEAREQLRALAGREGRSEADLLIELIADRMRQQEGTPP